MLELWFGTEACRSVQRIVGKAMGLMQELRAQSGMGNSSIASELI